MKKLIGYVDKEIKKHFIDYLVLLTGGILFLFFINFFSGQKIYQFITALIFSFFYIIWGLYHHILNQNLNFKTVIEYVALGFTVIFLLKILILP